MWRRRCERVSLELDAPEGSYIFSSALEQQQQQQRLLPVSEVYNEAPVYNDKRRGERERERERESRESRIESERVPAHDECHCRESRPLFYPTPLSRERGREWEERAQSAQTLLIRRRGSFSFALPEINEWRFPETRPKTCQRYPPCAREQTFA